MKEKHMANPNHLGHYHRDIVKIIDSKPYYVKVLMSCNHTEWISLTSYKKYKNDAILCATCSQLEQEQEICPYCGQHMKGKE